MNRANRKWCHLLLCKSRLHAGATQRPLICVNQTMLRSHLLLNYAQVHPPPHPLISTADPSKILAAKAATSPRVTGRKRSEENKHGGVINIVAGGCSTAGRENEWRKSFEEDNVEIRVCEFRNQRWRRSRKKEGNANRSRETKKERAIYI